MMIRRILILLFVFMLIALVVLFFFDGGWSRIKNAAHSINPLNAFLGLATSSGSVLPWEVPAPQGADLSQYQKEANAIQSGSSQSPQDQLASYQHQYDTLKNEVDQAKVFGTPSPYAHQVVISGVGGARSRDASTEYIEIHADPRNTGPVSLSGWTLQSAVTGVRVPIVPAAPHFVMGVINITQIISLNPDARVIIDSGSSPVGISFRENICTGYLQQFQHFSPDLNRACPDPSQSLPENPDTLRTYGGTCIDYVRSMPTCTFPTSLPTSLSAACKSFVQTEFSYNGCMSRYGNSPDFNIDLWRVYLGSPNPIWLEPHDIIRLLDDQGRTVDVLTY